MEAAIPNVPTDSPRNRQRGGLIRVLTVSAVMIVCWADAAAAQSTRTPSPQAGEAMKRSCKADYAAHCNGNDPAAPIAAACLAQYYINLSDVCRVALDAYNQSDTNR